MLASGQMATKLKNRYIRESTANGNDSNPPLPDSYKSTIPNQTEAQQKARDNPDEADPPNQPIPESEPPNHEESNFKQVGHDLKLNQSAMQSQKDKKDLAGQKLEDLAGKADNVLLKVSTVFPFTFFVHDIIIDPYKVNIIFREFYFSEQIHSIMVKDILDVVVETSLFFATIKFVDQGYVENTVDVAYLKKSDALKVRKVVQGLVIAHRQAVDLSILHPDEIRNQTEELGKVKGIDDNITAKPQFA